MSRRTKYKLKFSETGIALFHRLIFQNTGSAKAAYKNSMMYPNFTRELIGKNSPASFQGSIVIVNIGRLHPETSKFYFPICFGDIQCTHVESHSFLLFPFLG